MAAALVGADTSVPPGLGQVASLPSDPPPAALTNDTHYLVSNERRLDLLRGDVESTHGVYVGVGADQNYLLAGWAAPTFMVLIDFDQDVVDLHALHIAFLAVSSDGAAFESLWSDPEAAARVIAATALDSARRTRLTALFARAQPEVSTSLAKTRARFAELGVPCYLDDPSQYDRVATLARRGRILAKRGDFTQPGVVADVATVLTETGEDLGVLYLSNIEQYFMYGAGYRSNIAALPLGQDSVVLRTLPARPAGFEYLAQRGDDMQAWLRRASVRSVYRIRGYRRDLDRPASTRVYLRGPPPPTLRAAKPD
jgi:hypothetical protein